jgi:hypothetical protein
MEIKKHCRNCGQEFTDHTTNKVRVWCSEACRKQYDRKHSSFYKSSSNKGGEEMKIKEIVDVQELGETLLSGFNKRKKLIYIPKKRDIFKGKLEESAVLLLSDIHIGKLNYFVEEGTGKSVLTYNSDMMVQEANRLVESVYRINQLLAGSYNIKKLYIFGLGDLIDNEIIVRGQRHFVDVGVGAQLMLGVKLMTDLLTSFLKEFDEIEAVFIGGNHGRLTQHREMAPFYNNFDYLLGQMLAIAFKNEPRVKIITPESWFHTHKIFGWNYFLHHGNTVFSWMGFPYYGLVRSGKSRRTEMDIDMECIGHFHRRMEVPISSRSITLVNGCWIEKDEFGWRQYGNLTKPEQYYFGVSEKRPRTWSWNIELLKHTGGH